ncbi:MAG: hypothetical protein JWO95_3657 [Verrucomicrobiales bacterium]|nr:hypothetical protein [Verrucomicrobiales bacterium]
MLFSVVIVALVGGAVVSYLNGNRVWPSLVLIAGLVLVFLTLLGKGPFVTIAGLAALAAASWIGNNLDTSHVERAIAGQAVCCAILALVVLGFSVNFWLVTKLGQPRSLTAPAVDDPDPWRVAESLQVTYYAFLPLFSVALLLLALRFWVQLRKRRQPTECD